MNLDKLDHRAEGSTDRLDRAPARTHQWRGVVEEYRALLDIPADTPAVTLREGGTPAGALGVALRPHRRRGVAEGRGRQPHRVVQGPRHDRGDLGGQAPGRGGGGVRLDRQHVRVDGRLRRQGPAQAARARARGQDRGRQDGAGDHARRPGDHGARQLRRLPAAGQGPGRGVPGRAGELGEPGAAGGPEDRRVRDRRLPRRRPRLPPAPGRQRRQHLGVLARLPAVRRARAGHPEARDARLPGRRAPPRW